MCVSTHPALDVLGSLLDHGIVAREARLTSNAPAA